MRLYMSVVPAVGFGFFIFQASTTLGLFTWIRQLYLLFGIVVGLLIGAYEARHITHRLRANTESIVWKPLLFSAPLVCLPFLLVFMVFGKAEYLPFGVYFVLSAIPVYLATSGWVLSRFEQENGVRVFGLGLNYWTEKVEDVNARFYHFIKDVVVKQPSALWWHVGYVKKFVSLLEKKDIEPSTREEILELLKAMNRYRKMAFAVLGIFLISIFGLLFFFFVGVTGLVEIPERLLLNIIGPASGVILIGFFVSVPLVMAGFRRSTRKMLSNLDSVKLSNLQTITSSDDEVFRQKP